MPFSKNDAEKSGLKRDVTVMYRHYTHRHRDAHIGRHGHSGEVMELAAALVVFSLQKWRVSAVTVQVAKTPLKVLAGAAFGEKGA